MTLAPGTRLGPYEIVGQIGAGGMGEVYRAKDTKLGREVAIKVMPEGFAANSERLRRFQQEARTLAALSHPNVVQVYDAGEQEEHHYLVMELLGGETLRQYLKQGRLPWRKAVELAAAIADGLAAAHAKGIVHRDLKPDNLVLTEHGLKILDFGLAKVWSTTLDETSTVDTSPPGTLDGALLGTVGYMSPEQVQGKPADARSDLFSLGCVLYEMVTGNRAFARDSTMETLAAILKDPVPEPSISGSGGTPELDRIIGHCLEKAPGDRFHSAKDLAFDLRALLNSAPAAALGASADPVPSVPRPRSEWILPAAGILVLVLLAALLVWSPWKSKTPAYDPRCVAILPFENHTGDPSLDNLGQKVAGLVRQDLQLVPDVKVAMDPGPPSGIVGPATRARYVASGTYYLSGGEVEFQARVVDPWSGKVLYTLGPWRGPKGDPGKTLEEVRQYLSGAVAWCFNEYDWVPGSTRPPRMEALAVYQKARASSGGTKEFLAGCRLALSLDPDFFWPRYALFDRLVDTFNFAEAEEVLKGMESQFERGTPVERIWMRMCRALLEHRCAQVIQAIDEVRAIHPDTPLLLFKRAETEVHGNLPRGAKRDVLSIPKTALKFDKRALGHFLCAADHQAGNFKAELRIAHEAHADFPDDTWSYAREVSALAALGRVPEIRKILAVAPTLTHKADGFCGDCIRFTAAMELRAHGHAEDSCRIAESLLADLAALLPEERKKWRNSMGLLLPIVGKNQEALDLDRTLGEEATHLGWRTHYRGLVGGLLARLGRVEEARKVDAELAALASPYLFGEHIYHRACIAAELGEKDRAVDLLRQAFGEGFYYDDENHWEIALESLHGYPPYEELMKPKD